MHKVRLIGPQTPRLKWLFRTVNYEIGRRNEHLVIEAFEIAKKVGEIPDWLYCWELHEPFSSFDHNGIDITFMTDVNNIYVQVKSSEHFADIFREECIRRRKRIVIVVIDIEEPLTDIFTKVLAGIGKERDTILALRA